MTDHRIDVNILTSFKKVKQKMNGGLTQQESCRILATCPMLIKRKILRPDFTVSKVVTEAAMIYGVKINSTVLSLFLWHVT
mgnify:CR=1 FL=1